MRLGKEGNAVHGAPQPALLRLQPIQRSMKIAILKERRPHESRVAVTPETVKKLKALGAEEIVIETGAGQAAAYTDQAYSDAGAMIVPDAASAAAAGVGPATKEQVQSRGAKFVAVEDEEFKAAETAGGYAKEMSANYRAKQADLVAEHIKTQDIVITTALIPGRKAPVLVSEDMVKTMKPGSGVVDMPVEQRGNAPHSEYAGNGRKERG